MNENPVYYNKMQPFCPTPFIPFMPLMPKLANAYVPYQCLDCLYPPMKGLQQGTIFPELDRPYGVDPEYTVDA